MQKVGLQKDISPQCCVGFYEMDLHLYKLTNITQNT